MTIDERLERIAERHAALAQSLELFQRGTGEKIGALAPSPNRTKSAPPKS
ncbi:MAG TPA: hypothetical protein VN924_13985 [Bryobacteraceae bacterium]|nr:hypothetical protein [Bryobacteraceae bacterium]